MGGHDAITWAWGIGVTMACYIAARLSGAHLNPAVTVALAVCNGFPWRKVTGYIAAQMAGGAVAAFIVRALYNDLITKVDPDTTSATQTVFSTSPGIGVTLQTALFDQVLGTAILVFVVCALTAATNTRRWPTSNRWSSDCWWSSSAWPGARTRATRSTPRGTWARVSSPG
jgi:glycerol uptake facilitator protein